MDDMNIMSTTPASSDSNRLIVGISAAVGVIAIIMFGVLGVYFRRKLKMFNCCHRLKDIEETRETGTDEGTRNEGFVLEIRESVRPAFDAGGCSNPKGVPECHNVDETDIKDEPVAYDHHDDDDDDEDDDDTDRSRGEKPHQDIGDILTIGPSSLYPGQKLKELFDESSKKDFYDLVLHIVDKIDVAEHLSHLDNDDTKVDIKDGSVHSHGGSVNNTNGSFSKDTDVSFEGRFINNVDEVDVPEDLSHLDNDDAIKVDIKDGSVHSHGGSVKNTNGSYSKDTDGSLDGRFDNDGYNSVGDDVTSSSSDEEPPECVDHTFRGKHVVLKKDIRNMSNQDKELFADEKARRSYSRIPQIFSIIVTDNMTNFFRAIAREVQNVGLEDVGFRTSQTFYVIHLKLDEDNDYELTREGPAHLWLSCRPKQVVNHLSHVEFE